MTLVEEVWKPEDEGEVAEEPRYVVSVYHQMSGSGADMLYFDAYRLSKKESGGLCVDEPCLTHPVLLVTPTMSDHLQKEEFHPSSCKFVTGQILDKVRHVRQILSNGQTMGISRGSVVMWFVQELDPTLHKQRFGNRLEWALMTTLQAQDQPFLFHVGPPAEAINSFYDNPEFKASDAE